MIKDKLASVELSNFYFSNPSMSVIMDNIDFYKHQNNIHTYIKLLINTSINDYAQIYIIKPIIKQCTFSIPSRPVAITLKM